MIAVYKNVLVYAHRKDSPHHGAAASAIVRLAEGAAPWAIAWPCVHEFLSVATNPRIFKRPSPAEIAIRQLKFWMESPTLHLLAESTGYWHELRTTFLNGKLAGPQVHDARHLSCKRCP